MFVLWKLFFGFVVVRSSVSILCIIILLYGMWYILVYVVVDDDGRAKNMG